MSSFQYPASPANVDERILEPSSNFKAEATKVLVLIGVFIVTYLLLITVALGLMIACAMLGLGLVILKPMAITIMLGLGLVGLGVMVTYFLVKFMFKRHKVDRSGLTEIKESDHPRLFEFIRMLTRETRTPFPKRIYLSNEVNASVFYDSSFWSMFLPVRKNLLIGLGLVNSVNISEFKAILAHEFGHFSQRSMKLGSYVYNLNQIIFNLLYDNDSYERRLQDFGNASGYFKLFAITTAQIVKGVQWLLKQLYKVINKQYMSLSRQMEFHADTVAASVSGANHLISSLRRLDIADATFHDVFTFYNERIKEGLKSENIYTQHSEVMKVYSTFKQLPLSNGLPQVNAQLFRNSSKSRLSIKDQWASHPSVEDREAHLQSLRIETPAHHESAWVLFNNPADVQKESTAGIFAPVQYNTDITVVDDKNFAHRFHEYFYRYQYPTVYRGFYDNRNIPATDLTKVDGKARAVSFGEVLSEEVISLPARINGLKNDIQTLEYIAEGKSQINNFDLDGFKYKSADATRLKRQLEDELKQLECQLAEADDAVISWFLHSADRAGMKEHLRQQYSHIFAINESCEEDRKIYMQMQEWFSPLFQTMPYDQIRETIKTLKQHEPQFKKRLRTLFENPDDRKLFDNDQLDIVGEYLTKDWEYFRGQDYLQSQVDSLSQSLAIFRFVSVEKSFLAQSELLKQQLEYVGLEARVQEHVR